MPIVFEQAGPYDPATSVAFGELQQYERDREFQSRSRRMFPAGPVSSGGYGGGGGGGHGGGDRMYELQSEINAAQLSQAENIRYQRLQNGLAELNAQAEQGLIEPEDASALRLQLMTGINPLQQRMAKAQVAHTELANQQIMDQHARMETMDQEAAKVRAMTLEQRTREVPDDTMLQGFRDDLRIQFPLADPDQIEQQARLLTRRNGGMTRWFIDAQGNPQLLSQGGEGRARGQQQNQNAAIPGLDAAHMATTYQHIMAAVDRLEPRQFGQIRDPQTGEMRQRTYEEEVAARFAMTQQHLAAALNPQPAGQPVRPVQPVDENLPREKQPPAVRTALDRLDRLSRAVPPEMRDDLAFARWLVMRYRVVEAMPPADRAEYEAILARLAGAGGGTQAAPQGPRPAWAPPVSYNPWMLGGAR